MKHPHDVAKRALVLWLAAGLGLGFFADWIGLAPELTLLGVVGCGLGAGLCALGLSFTGRRALETTYIPFAGFALKYVFC